MTHTTKYGNTYTDQEWAEMKAYFKQQKANDDAIGAKIRGLEKFLRRMLVKEGLNGDQVQVVVNLFKNESYEEANIQWTSQGRKTIIDDLYSRWDKAMARLFEEAKNLENDLADKKTSIMENSHDHDVYQ
jgi:hypothetical protein